MAVTATKKKEEEDAVALGASHHYRYGGYRDPVDAVQSSLTGTTKAGKRIE